MDRKPTIPLYVSLFAGLYILLAFVVGYTINWFRVEPSTRVNDFIIVMAACITTYWFTRREKRHFTNQERFEIIFGSIATDITIQIASALLFTSNFDLANTWSGLLAILLGHAMLIALIHSLLQKVIPLSNQSA